MEFDYLCGKGARAEVYRKGDYAYKVFEPDYSKTAAFYEAFINVVVYETGLPVPKTYELVEIEGRLALRQDFVCGKAFRRKRNFKVADSAIAFIFFGELKV